MKKTGPLKSYTAEGNSLGQFVQEALALARGRTRAIPGQVADTIARVRAIETLAGEALRIRLCGLQMLDVGAGQLSLQAICFAVRNDVVGIDLDVIARGFHLGRYVEMARRNGLRRTVKTMGRKVLLVDARYRRELSRQLGVARLPVPPVLTMDAAEMTFADSSFDFVYALAIFQHLERPGAVLREMRRVLRPGGGLYVDFMLHTGPWESHDVRVLAGDGGALPLWAHLRPRFAGEIQTNAFLNRLRLAEWRAMIESEAPGATVILRQPQAERLDVEARELQRCGELLEYSLEELLTSQVAAIWRKPDPA